MIRPGRAAATGRGVLTLDLTIPSTVRHLLRTGALSQESSLQILVGQVPINTPRERQPQLILWQKGTSVRFLTVFELLGPRAPDERSSMRLSGGAHFG
jgi:hypothetical protein